jgi:hypothetical protein
VLDTGTGVEVANPEFKKFLSAVFLGGTVFIIAPLLLLFAGGIVLLLNTVLKDFHPVIAVAGPLGLKEAGLGGFFISQFIVVAFLVLLSGGGSALVSWFVFHSRKLAVVTFCSAIIIVIIQAVFVSWMMTSGMRPVKEAEEALSRYASLGEAGFEVAEPFSESMAMDGKMVDLSLFRKLTIIVPVNVAYPGKYQVYLDYADQGMGLCARRTTTVDRSLGAGLNSVRVEFINEPRRFGCFEHPEANNGVATVKLAYLASREELTASLKSVNSFVKPTVDRFIKDEERDPDYDPARLIPKFIEEKSFQFGRAQPKERAEGL